MKYTYKTMVTHIYNVCKCPFCGNEISRWDKKTVEHFGNPLVQCPKCGKTVLDSNNREMAVRPWQWYVDRQYKAPGFTLKALVYGWLPALGIALFVYANFGSSGGLGLYGRRETTFLILLAISIALYVAGIVVFLKKGSGGPYVIGSAFEKEYKESEKRLSNPVYREFLNRTGYFKSSENN